MLLGDRVLDLRYATVTTRSSRSSTRSSATRVDASHSTGTIGFPDNGEPQFDIAVDVTTGYPAQRAIDAVALDLKSQNRAATGKLIVSGTGEEGTVCASVDLARNARTRRQLNGTALMPGKKTSSSARSATRRNNFPVAARRVFDPRKHPGDRRLHGHAGRIAGRGVA